jgi:hypothetical protein
MTVKVAVAEISDGVLATIQLRLIVFQPDGRAWPCRRHLDLSKKQGYPVVQKVIALPNRTA